ncbi:methanogenesis marker 17 protein [Methanimicrococcus blatticola]|uniref:Putative methanogenesis marker protein 17 n=1 Tax=Methanimicrococcus blatticola TaxID=91560 RepID=A0A484F475_9EURY|nr:methanogenesis marker 17 protein [Methanimicrococcus blatticola]MBZ3935664.1 methanogenesis marker 17 protein [Methanimicrococcus blatticola]MCC2508215.1 methanogenesis marker 17 protein [Methanimicrococcus blatticola]TDQ68707.1 putative methanogenesis marker protein 17 [Methanimicrococcus blatticola]
MNMEPLEIFTVYSAVESEAAVYRDITADVMSDLRLASAVGRIRVEIYPAKSLYMMTAILRDVEMPIRISDMATVETSYENGEDYVKITIDREKYMPDLTRYLWDKYTPANVVQADRWTILVRAEDSKKDAADLPAHIIANPSKNLHADMVEFSIRAVPEGFRVRYHTFENNEFTFIASEDIIEPNQLNHAKKMMDELRSAVPDVTETKNADGKEKREARNRAENTEEEQ